MTPGERSSRMLPRPKVGAKVSFCDLASAKPPPSIISVVGLRPKPSSIFSAEQFLHLTILFSTASKRPHLLLLSSETLLLLQYKLHRSRKACRQVLEARKRLSSTLQGAQSKVSPLKNSNLPSLHYAPTTQSIPNDEKNNALSQTCSEYTMLIPLGDLLNYAPHSIISSAFSLHLSSLSANMAFTDFHQA